MGWGGDTVKRGWRGRPGKVLPLGRGRAHRLEISLVEEKIFLGGGHGEGSNPPGQKKVWGGGGVGKCNQQEESTVERKTKSAVALKQPRTNQKKKMSDKKGRCQKGTPEKASTQKKRSAANLELKGTLSIIFLRESGVKLYGQMKTFVGLSSKREIGREVYAEVPICQGEGKGSQEKLQEGRL